MPTASDIITDAQVESILDRPLGRPAELGGISEHTNGRPNVWSDTDRKVLIFEAGTGEPRLIPEMYLRKTLQKRSPLTGRPVFVAADPATGQPMAPVPEYQAGTLKCFLHPDHPDRDELEEMGIGRDIICGDGETAPAGSFRTRFDLRNHEQKRHKRSWEIREEARARQAADADRAETRRYTEAILKLAGTGAVAARPLHICEADDCDRFFDSPQGLAMHVTRDHGRP